MEAFVASMIIMMAALVGWDHGDLGGEEVLFLCVMDCFQRTDGFVKMM